MLLLQCVRCGKPESSITWQCYATGCRLGIVSPWRSFACACGGCGDVKPSGAVVTAATSTVLGLMTASAVVLQCCCCDGVARVLRGALVGVRWLSGVCPGALAVCCFDGVSRVLRRRAGCTTVDGTWSIVKVDFTFDVEFKSEDPGRWCRWLLRVWS